MFAAYIWVLLAREWHSILFANCIFVARGAGIRLEIPEDGLAFRQTMTEIQTLAERKLIERALRDVEGNRTRAARALGLARRTLLYKMERLGIH